MWILTTRSQCYPLKWVWLYNTHTQPFNNPLSGTTWVPEETFTHSHPCGCATWGGRRIHTDNKVHCMGAQSLCYILSITQPKHSNSISAEPPSSLHTTCTKMCSIHNLCSICMPEKNTHVHAYDYTVYMVWKNIHIHAGSSPTGSIHSPFLSSFTPSLFHSRHKTFLFCKSFPP